ncbi:winged helix-turn-helix domain-containing protein [bacterium]|nr:winged helix-turn-helix domain-containing protein [bacterium]
MNLLDFLVTSETRKALLRLLWVDDLEASGHQLAQLADAAYSAVHSELEAMKNEGLVTTRKEGKAVMFRKNNNYNDRKALSNLLANTPKTSSSYSRKPTDDEVRLNLSKFGAPLGVHGESEVDLSLEETLAYAMKLARRDSTVARVLPVVFAKNKDVVDFPRLEFMARKLEVLPVLGLFLDLTASLLKSQKLHKLAQGYDDRRRKHTENFFVNKKLNRFENELAEKNTPPVARSWRFLLNMGMDSFEDLFRKTFPGSQRA